MTKIPAGTLSKVPEVTLLFWIIKILATTLGETGGDAVTMTMIHADRNAHNGGYLIGTGIFVAVFIAAVVAQIAMKTFHPFIYWITIVATTTLGTTMADFADRSLGIGYAGGSSLLLAVLLASSRVWRWREGSISVYYGRHAARSRCSTGWRFSSRRRWARRSATGWPTPTGSATKAARSSSPPVWRLSPPPITYTTISHTLLFWTAFILTRPLGATLGDLLDKPIDHGGLAISRYLASGILAAIIVALVLIVPQTGRRASRSA